MHLRSTVFALVLCVLGMGVVIPQNLKAQTTEPAQMIGSSPASGDWEVTPLFTVGESIGGYTPAGVMDGIGAMRLNHHKVRLFVNHELTEGAGYPYYLNNKTKLTGARISYFDIDRYSRKVVGSGLAYHKIIDREGKVVRNGSQIDPGNSLEEGIRRLCSASLFKAGMYNLVDDIFMTGEETDGGQEFALDVKRGVLYALPWMGRAAWENVTFVDSGDYNKVAVIVGDDRAGAPLLLYVGYKNWHGDGSFLDRNGLAYGKLYAWVSSAGDISPENWNGTGTERNGHFKEIKHYDASKAGTAGYDAQGFVTQEKQDELAAAVGAFQFSRPEDVATNPKKGNEVVLASTGRGGAYPSDDWGTVYRIQVDVKNLRARLRILYDGDDAGNGQFSDPDYGLRSPDNLDWADNGMIYLQEDRSTSNATFGGVSGIEASLWEMNPKTGKLKRIGVVDRAAVPAGQTDTDPTDLGDWETSGVLDITHLFPTKGGETLLIADVQAHSLRGGAIDSENLVEGGQLVMISNYMGKAYATAPAAGDELVNVVEKAGLPTEFAIEQNYPNPFNPTTTIVYNVPEASEVKVAVYNMQGQEVGVLVQGSVAAGRHEVTFEAGKLPSGLYLVRVQTAENVYTRRITLIK